MASRTLGARWRGRHRRRAFLDHRGCAVVAIFEVAPVVVGASRANRGIPRLVRHVPVSASNVRAPGLGEGRAS
eukprot:9037730-Alexandrium_andersonii.AAC.1